jgi:hypothetical protein
MNQIRFNFSDEFSWMLSQHAPIAYYHKNKGMNVIIDSLRGTDELFYFADELNKREQNSIFSGGTQVQEIYKHDFNPLQTFKTWEPPPYQEHFSKECKIKETKPVIVISNKYNPEWSEKVPRNFLSLSFIKKFFEKFHNDYKIYYIRYDGGGKDTEGYYDDVGSLEFKDWDIVKQFKGISTVYDVMNEYDIGFNRAQFWIHSMAEHTVSCAGGNAVLSAYFGNDVLIYGHPNCKSTPRGIWKTNSWLTKLGCKKVMGTQNYEELLQMCEMRWL